MNRVSFFELATPDPAREMDFFSSVLGWKIEKWGDQEYWLVTTGPAEETGIDGAIMPLRMAEQPRCTNTVTVANVDDAIANAKAAGATVALEKMEVPDTGWVAYLLSPTGILFGVIEMKPGASM